MSERSWNVVLWIGMLGAVGAVIATFASYTIMQQTTYPIIFFIIALLFALIAAIANIAVSRVRQNRWSGELAAQQQRVEDLFASAQHDSNSKHLGPEARALSDEATAEGESLAEEQAEHERVEHGNWE